MKTLGASLALVTALVLQSSINSAGVQLDANMANFRFPASLR